MHKRLGILLLFVFIVNCIHKTFANNCNAFDNLKRAFNLGEHVFLQTDRKSYQKFDSQYKRVVDRMYSSDEIFGDTFLWVDTAFTFTFDECDPISRSETFCELVRRADGLVIVIGKRRDVLSYGYVAFRSTEDGRLIKLTEDPNVFGFKKAGLFTDDLWEIPGLKASKLYVHSSVFIGSRNQLILTILDSVKFSNNVYLMSRKLEDNGQWSPQWTQIPDMANDMIGMFDIDGRVFGFDRTSNAYEFVLIGDNDIAFNPISNIRELLNCFDNSTVGQPITSPLTFTTTAFSSSTESVTQTTSATTSATTESPSVTTSSTESSIEAEIESNAIETELSTGEPREEVTGAEVELLSHTSVEEQELNQRLEESSDESQDWSVVFIIAIIALVAAIIIAVILIVRNKSKTRILYLNSKSDESKSCEMPLNNNNDNSVQPKDTEV